MTRLDTLTSNLNGKPHPTPHAHWYTSPAPNLDWIFDQTVPLGIVGGVNARGGAGKSMLTQTLIISACTGATMLPSFVPVSPVRTLWFESEDTPDELHRRAEKIFRAYNLDSSHAAQVAQNLTVYAGNAKPFIEPDRKNVYHATEHYRWLCEEIDRIQPSFICIGSRAHYYSGDENDNAAVTQFMGLLSAAAQRVKSRCTIWLIHHVAKATENEPNAASGRGASAARDAMRSLYSMVDLSPHEVQEYGISNPHLFAKLVNTKANWSPLAGKPIILRRETGINGGVLHEADLQQQAQEVKQDMLAKVATAVVELIGDNPDRLTVRQLIYEKIPGAQDIRAAIKMQFKDWGTRQHLIDAINYALKIDLISLDIGTNNEKVLRKSLFSDRDYE